ncbi:hypothetical protein [Micromonospora sp. NPDC005367]|uniref:hypothetical protein n=1 Tax=Micromonospora sp. NPDC005367 TaxID=3155590 RepID=UPI0033AE92FF
MDVRARDRLRGGVLVGLTVLALVAGGSWWRANAPVDERSLGLAVSLPGLAARAPGVAPPVAGLAAPLALGVPLVPPRSGARQVAVVDPATGVAVRVDPGSRYVFRVEEDGSAFRIDPETGAAYPLDQGWGTGEVQPRPGPSGQWGSGELSRYPNTLWRERTLIAPERSLIRQVNGRPDDPYLFEYLCTGSSGLIVTIKGSQSVDLRPICDGQVRRSLLIAVGGPLRVEVGPLGAEPVRVQMQLAAVD